jgi:CubicO group peptidase (beta-lactamase class C family)
MSQFNFPRSTPEAQGLRSSAVLDFVNSLKNRNIELHSLMILRNAHVVASAWWKPYGPQIPHSLYSLTKSFTSTAAGFAVSEGLFTLDDKVISFFPDKLPDEVSDNLAAIRVRDLLTMTSGFLADPMHPVNLSLTNDWVRTILAQPVPYTPGETFQYNSSASHMVSAIVQATSGLRVQDYLGPRLFEPLGFGEIQWQNCPSGMSIGGWGLKLRTEDLARLGVLYVQDGVWNGKRVLLEGWAKLASSRQVENGPDPENDWNQGYGFQFWRCRHNVFRGDGAFGQYCVVMPDQNAVIAITSGIGDMQAVLTEIWDHLLPAMTKESFPDDNAAHSTLLSTLEAASLSYPSNGINKLNDVNERGSYIVETEGSSPFEVDFAYSGGTAKICFSGSGALAIRSEHWSDTGAKSFQDVEGPIIGRGAWTDQSTYRAHLVANETPFGFDVSLRFSEDGKLDIDIQRNVGFDGAPVKKLFGKRSKK